MKYFASLCLALLLFACNNATTTVNDRGATTDMDRTPPMEAKNLNSTLNSTLDAVKTYNGDVTALPGNVAVSNIDTWMTQLRGVDGAEKVTWNLEALKNTLSQSPINGQLAGMQLISLAEDTRNVGGTSGKLGNLASALKAGGEKLIGSSFSGNDLLPQTLGVVRSKGADITTLPAGAAVDNIDSWINTLSKMNGTGAITSDLNALKIELGKSRIDGMKVGNLLQSLATKTRSVGGDNMGLSTLAYALEAGSARLLNGNE